MSYITIFKYPLRNFSVNYTVLKIKTNFGDYVHFLRVFHLKFTVNANIVYIPAESKFSMSISCSNHHSQVFLTVGLSLRLLCPDLPDPSPVLYLVWQCYAYSLYQCATTKLLIFTAVCSP